jgi:hypothetical protein
MFPTFDIAEIAEEAAERAGIDFRAGYALRTARRSIELLSIEWGNRGLNLWTVEADEVPLVPGVDEYFLDTDTIDLLEHNLRTYDQDLRPTDFPLARLSMSEFAVIPSKTNQGRPTSIHIKRKITPSFLLWPVPPNPPNATYSVVYLRMRRMASVGQGGTGEPELPFRFVPAMVAGVAYYLAAKSKDPDAQQRVPMLKAAYEEQFTLASDEDRDRAPVRWVPWSYLY